MPLAPATRPRLVADGPVLVFGGVCGNVEATRALLAAAGRLAIPPSRIVCTGDLAAPGADPGRCVDLLRRSGVAVCAGDAGEPLGAGEPDRTSGLPVALELCIAGRRLLVLRGGVEDPEPSVWPSNTAEIDRQLALAGADGVIASRCGLPFTRIGPLGLWHDPGAIGRPANDGTRRGWFGVLVPAPDGLELRHHALTYDAADAARAVRRAGLPESHAAVLLTGLWPGDDPLPEAERLKRGRALEDARLFWPDAREAARPGVRSASPPARFSDRHVTANGERRACVPLRALRTLWFNTGTLCNVTCVGCYIESSPVNDRLAYLTRADIRPFLREARSLHPELEEIALTGGEPFMNRDTPAIMSDALQAGYRVLVLTNAMRPMRRFEAELLQLRHDHGDRLTVRVSLDHHTAERHEAVRGAGSWRPAIAGLRWLDRHGFAVAVAGRTLWDEDVPTLRNGYRALFAELGLAIDCSDPGRLVLFPEMDARHDVPEITESCWAILGKQPDDVMCASARMVVKRRGAGRPSVVSCTLLPYDERFELGPTLAQAGGPVHLNHRFCAQFCVLGGASCSP